MVLEYYKLSEQPFGVTPDPRYLFMSGTHREALASMLYAVSAGRGFTALIAKPGMGKTTLLFDFLNVVKDHAKTAFVFQSQCSPQDMLHNLLHDLDIEDDGGDIMRMQRKLNDCLLLQASRGKQLVVVIDEAQNLSESVLEVVRMLSNFETSREKLMHFVLAGQPELARKLASASLTQLRQRISIVARLKSFTADDTQLYIAHRLHVAGYDFERPLFTKRAYALIASYSEGIPRNINNLCFNAISLGCVSKQKTIDADVIQEVLGDLDLRPLFTEPDSVSKPAEPIAPAPALLSHEKPRSPWQAWSVRFALALVLVASVSWLFVRGKGHTVSTLASTPSPAVNSSPASAPASYSVPPSHEPLAVSAPVPSTSQSAESGSILVHPGETLYRISLKVFGGYNEETLEALRELNPWLTDPRLIRPGQKIKVPVTSSMSHKILAEHVPVVIGAGAEKP